MLICPAFQVGVLEIFTFPGVLNPRVEPDANRAARHLSTDTWVVAGSDPNTPNGQVEHLVFPQDSIFPGRRGQSQRDHSRVKSLGDIANEAGIGDLIIEKRERFPFLHILNFLTRASGVLVIGSTESHYTASKIFQSLLSKKPLFAILHGQSSAVKILDEASADQYLVEYEKGKSMQDLEIDIEEKLKIFIKFNEDWQPNYGALNKYSAKESARKLVDAVNEILT